MPAARAAAASSRPVAAAASSGRPVAYLRRSKVQAKNTGAVSHEVQVQKVTELAGADAPNLKWIEDWGKSGQAKTQHRRTAYAELRTMVEAGNVSVIYTWTLSRLARSLTELNDLAHLCADHKVPIRCADGFSPDVSTPTGRLVLSLLGAIHQYQAEWSAEAAANTISIRRERGDVLGAIPYGALPGEDTAKIVAAFQQAGSFLGACNALNAAGITPRRGGPWTVTSVARILRRPELAAAPRAHRQGARAGRATRLFSRLLVCGHCGVTLTSMPRDGSVAYYCRRAHMDSRHPRPYTIREHKLVPWAKAEIIRGVGSHMLDIRYRDRSMAIRADLEARRDRVVNDYFDMTGDKNGVVTRLAAIDAELLAIGEADRSIEAIALTPTIIWTAPPGEINARLRALWRSVTLGPDLLPVSADWYVSRAEYEAAEDALTATLREGW